MSHTVVLNTLWDLLLAAIPAALGWIIAGGWRRSPRRAWLWAPMLLIWLVFLPNTCYLLTEIRHLRRMMIYDYWQDVWGPDGLQKLIFWSAFYGAFSGFGMLSFALSIRPLERLARERGVPVSLLAPFFFGLVSLGVYLGLRLRFNSWDVVRNPQRVMESAAQAMAGTGRATAYILGFGLFLWAAYALLDVWLDGAALRWQRWRKGSPAQTSSGSGS